MSERPELSEVKLDLVIGRGLLSDPKRWNQRIKGILGLLSATGRAVCLERDPEETQRLSAGVCDRLTARGEAPSDELLQAWRAAEARAYEAVGSAWRVCDLRERWASLAGLAPEQIQIERMISQRPMRIESERARRWLSDHPESYLSRLSAVGLTSNHLDEVRRCVERIRGDSLSWRIGWLVLGLRCV